VLQAVSLTDGFVQARFKAISGREDQRASVWRWRDANNYYVARANALENNVVAYKVVGGRRTAIAPVGTPAGTLRHGNEGGGGRLAYAQGRVPGPEAAVIYDGARLFTVRDETLHDAGKVGVWSRRIASRSSTPFQHGDKS